MYSRTGGRYGAEAVLYSSTVGVRTDHCVPYLLGRKSPRGFGKGCDDVFGRAVTYDSNNNSEILYLGMSELRGKKISSSKQPIASLDFVSTQIERPMTIDDEKL